MTDSKSRRDQHCELAAVMAVVVAARFCSDCTKDIRLARSDAGDFSALDGASGELLFRVKCEASSMGLSRRWIMRDSLESVLLCLKKRRVKLHKGWIAYSSTEIEDDNVLFTVKRASVLDDDAINVFLACSSDVTSPDFKVIRLNNGCSITSREGNTVAQGKDQVQVVAGVDTALLAALLFFWDEQTGMLNPSESLLEATESRGNTMGMAAAVEKVAKVAKAPNRRGRNQNEAQAEEGAEGEEEEDEEDEEDEEEIEISLFGDLVESFG